MNPQTLQMLMALQGNQQQGMGVAPGMQQNAMPNQNAPFNQPLAPGSTAPLMNGQNASLGGASGASLGTPQDAMYAAMMAAPQSGGF